jgi:release factor glutamine methyltransferase
VTLEVQLLEKLRHSWVPLPDKADETPELTVRALAEVAGSDERMNELVQMRISGVPLSHLIGRQMFMDIQMLAGPEALIPRKETELLGRGALAILNDLIRERGHARVIDVCCGSGNVALGLASHALLCQVEGADLSADAVALANRNNAHLGLQNRCRFVVGDLFEPFSEPVDLVTCNPPYISTGKLDKMPHEIASFEPKLAFDGGPFGVKILTRLIREAPRCLKPDSWLAFEVGLGQGKAMVKMLSNLPDYRGVQTITDGSGEIRVVVARTALASV